MNTNAPWRRRPRFGKTPGSLIAAIPDPDASEIRRIVAEEKTARRGDWTRRAGRSILFFALGVACVWFDTAWASWISAHLPRLPPPQIQSRIDEIGSVIHEIGFAIIVAVVVGWLIEESARAREEREHRQQRIQIARGVFEAVFGVGLKPLLRHELTEIIPLCHFIREKVLLEYEFSQAPLGPDDLAYGQLVKVRFTVSYNAVNTSAKPQTYKLFQYVDNTIPRPECATTFLDYQIGDQQAGNGKGSKIYSGKELRRYASAQGMRQELKLPAMTVEPGASVPIRMSQEFVRRSTDSDLWITNYPATGLRMSVTVDEALRNINLCFMADASHRLRIKQLDDHKGARRWEIDTGILPSQGVILYWYTHNAEQAQEPMLYQIRMERADRAWEASLFTPQGSPVQPDPARGGSSDTPPGRGKTWNAAIGDLVCRHPQRFGLDTVREYQPEEIGAAVRANPTAYRVSKIDPCAADVWARRLNDWLKAAASRPRRGKPSTPV